MVSAVAVAVASGETESAATVLASRVASAASMVTVIRVIAIRAIDLDKTQTAPMPRSAEMNPARRSRAIASLLRSK
jgi:hypothetical protein